MLFTIPNDRSQTEFARCKLECSYWYHLKCFLASSVFPSFLVRKIENESFPYTYALGEWTRWVLGDNSYRVRTNTWKELRRCCSPIGHNKSIFIKAFFVPNQEPALSWPFGMVWWVSWYPGGLPPVLENFCCAFSLDPTEDCPWVSVDGFTKLSS